MVIRSNQKKNERTGETLSHGNLSGTFGYLTITNYAGLNSWGRKAYTCICRCGKKVTVAAKYLVSGHTKSCGCFRQDTTSKRVYRHGYSHTDTHNIWQGIKQRCFNPKRENYERYGGRGITMSLEWKNSFEQFLKDMGPRPSKQHSIERLDNNGNYEAANCTWILSKHQSSNRRNRKH